jgi:ATP-binding protein involved in chromosome partitioning
LPLKGLKVLKKLFSRKKKPIKQPTQALSNDNTNIKQIIIDALTEYRSAVFEQGILASCLDYNISVTDKKIVLSITMPFACTSELTLLVETLNQTLAINIKLEVNLAIEPVRNHTIANVANIIAIASGKGGVGKSTTTVNLAYALQAEGAKVAILDADIYGPSIPTLLGLKNSKPSSADGKNLTPLNAHGICAMSIGFLVPESDATVWRGPMASSAFNQLLNETAWPEVDYLLVDMPPGTGDIQLTLAQKVPVAAAVIVTTPQDIALADAVKGIAMFDKVKVPVLGVIENMSYHRCEKCGHQSPLFGQNGGVNIAKKYHTPLLGQLPLAIDIRADADKGLSCLINDGDGELANTYKTIARKLAMKLFEQLDSRSSKTPEIAIKN